jgi:uncharacterized membrane protein
MKKETQYLIGLFIAIIIFSKIIFYKESAGTILQLILSLFYLLILPAFAWLYYWHKELSFMHRFIISFAASLAIVGIESYYLGLLGLDLKTYAYFVPALMIISGYLFNLKWNK